MQKTIIFIEPNDEAFATPEKIGNIFMNRFAIDEDTSFEILNIFEFGKTSIEISNPNAKNYENFVEEQQQKGMDHFIMIQNNKIFRL